VANVRLFGILETVTQRAETGKQPTITFEQFKDIYESVEALRRIENKPPEKLRHKSGEPVVEPSRKDLLEAFLKWSVDMGVEISPNIELHDFGIPFGYGFRAKNDFEPGEVLFRVPASAMMSRDTAEESDLNKYMAGDSLYDGMEPVKLSLHLLNEKFNPESKWAPYIAALPKTYATTLEFSLEDYELLKGTSALGMCCTCARGDPVNPIDYRRDNTRF
jgi:hypothetical protein